MYSLIISSVANVILDLLFVAVFNWGVAGAAIATDIVSIGLTFIQRAVNEFGKTMIASFTVGQRIEQYINLGVTVVISSLIWIFSSKIAGLFGFGIGCIVAWTYFLSGRWKR